MKNIYKVGGIVLFLAIITMVVSCSSSDGGDTTTPDTTTPDTTAPFIALHGPNPMAVIKENFYTEPGATAIDDRDSDVTVLITGNVNTSTVGEYIIEYSATDRAGNTATKERTVNVVNAEDINASIEVYEDAENGETEGWRVYDTVGWSGSDNVDGGTVVPTITNVYDNYKTSHVIQLSGNGTDNGYKFGEKWNNAEAKIFEWSLKYTYEFFVIYIKVNTSEGERYLLYRPVDPVEGKEGKKVEDGIVYIYIALGSDANNDTWQTFTRDLRTDLEKYEPGNVIETVDSFLIRGSGLVDDIQFIKP